MLFLNPEQKDKLQKIRKFILNEGEWRDLIEEIVLMLYLECLFAWPFTNPHT